MGGRDGLECRGHFFPASADRNVVPLFHEADAIAGRLILVAGPGLAAREATLSSTRLLQELETFNGVVIFATNMAANFDRAFERRIRTSVLFEIPGVHERARIWRVQIHPTLTPFG